MSPQTCLMKLYGENKKGTRTNSRPLPNYQLTPNAIDGSLSLTITITASPGISRRPGKFQASCFSGRIDPSACCPCCAFSLVDGCRVSNTNTWSFYPTLRNQSCKDRQSFTLIFLAPGIAFSALRELFHTLQDRFCHKAILIEFVLSKHSS